MSKRATKPRAPKIVAPPIETSDEEFYDSDDSNDDVITHASNIPSKSNPVIATPFTPIDTTKKKAASVNKYGHSNPRKSNAPDVISASSNSNSASTATSNAPDFDKSKYKFYLMTTHTIIAKQCFERLNGFVKECNLIIRQPKYDEDGNLIRKGGIKIMELNKDQTLLVRIEMYDTKFEQFYCSQDTITVGLDVEVFNNNLKQSFCDNSPLIIFMENTTASEKIYLRSVLYSTKENGLHEATNVKIDLMDPIENQVTEIPKFEIKGSVVIPMDKFRSIFKMFKNATQKYIRILLEYDGDTKSLTFEGTAESSALNKTFSYDRNVNMKNPIKFGSDSFVSTAYEPSKDGDASTSSTSKPISTKKVIDELYELKHLQLITRSSKTQTDIILHIDNDMPLVINIPFDELGTCIFILIPGQKEDDDA
ncbi:Proliferating cell nuclear antigen [uncultured virus]|nr:Proliferating cell nuclear antigen [uncultured virus]